MSILKTTNSGTQQKLTIDLLKQLGYKHPFVTETFHFDYDYSKLEKDFIDKQYVETLTIFLGGEIWPVPKSEVKFQIPEYPVQYNKENAEVYKGYRFAVHFYPETLEDLVFLESIFKKYILYGKPIPMTEVDCKKRCVVFCIKSKKTKMDSVKDILKKL